MSCVNIKSKEFKDAANRLNLDSSTLENIVHEFQNKGNEGFPTDDYIQSKLEGSPLEGASDIQISLWDKMYNAPLISSTREEANAIMAEASKYFPSKYIIQYQNASGKYVTKVAKPLKEIYHEHENVFSNKKKDDAHLNKHAMHLIRLYLMCLDILEKQEINTFREHDISLLMSIRNGEFQNEDGTFRTEFYQMVDEFEKRMDYAKANTSLPEKPDYKRIEEFTMFVNEYTIVLNRFGNQGWEAYRERMKEFLR